MKASLEALRLILDTPAERGAKGRALAEVIRRARSYRWVGLYDIGPAEVVAVAWTGPTPPAFPRFPVSQGLTGAAVQSRAPVIVQDVTQDPRWLTTFSTTQAEAIFPVVEAGGTRVVGTIDVESDQAGAFGPEDTDFLANVTRILAPYWPSRGEPRVGPSRS